MSIYDRIRQTLGKYPHHDDDTVAVAVLNDLGIAREPAKELLPLVEAAVESIRRNETREVERRVFATPTRKQASFDIGDEPIDVLSRRHELVGLTFVIEGGTRVEWEKATVADHESRIRRLRGQIVGLSRTIAAHEEAIRLIERFGVRCLAEIIPEGGRAA